MKKIGTLILALGLIIGFAGCKHEPDNPILDSIEIREQPTKTTYMVGEALDTTGMKVYAIYDTGSEALITDWKTSGFDSSKAAENQEVIVRYTENYVTKTATFKVTIKAPPVTLSEISVTAQPTKKEYYVGDTFDKTGLKVTAKYSDTTTKDVTSSCTFSGFDSSKAVEKQTVTVSYKEGDVTKTTTIDVKINAVVLKSIAITKNPTKMTYKVGEELKTDGMVVTATYNSGKLAPVTGWTTSGFDSSKPGTTEVTISYTEGGVTQQTKIKFTVSSETRTVNFDANGGTGSMDAQTFSTGVSQAVNECTFTRKTEKDYSVFTGWNTKADGTGISYKNKESIKITEDTTLYAQWEVVLKFLSAGTDGSYGTEGTYVEFGEWPQTKKADAVTVDENVTKQAGMYTYYKGSDNEWYAKVNSDYYKVEPIKWRVFDEAYDVDGNKGSATGKLLVAENILTGNVTYYEDIDNNRTIDDKTVYPNNYMHSRIRAYLNGISYNAASETDEGKWLDKGFFQTAFGETAQQAIITTKVDNSEDSTTNYDITNGTITKATTYACDPTDDKIFLLSEYEVTKYSRSSESYKSSGKGNSRIRFTTDFAKANNVNQSQNEGEGGYWLLRSPLYIDSRYARNVGKDGNAINDNYIVYYTGNGIVPALCISY